MVPNCPSQTPFNNLVPKTSGDLVMLPSPCLYSGLHCFTTVLWWTGFIFSTHALWRSELASSPALYLLVSWDLERKESSACLEGKESSPSASNQSSGQDSFKLSIRSEAQARCKGAVQDGCMVTRPDSSSFSAFFESLFRVNCADLQLPDTFGIRSVLTSMRIMTLSVPRQKG